MVRQVIIRKARRDDVPEIAAMFASDLTGGHGDTADPEAMDDYYFAFDEIASRPGDIIYVAELDGEIVGTYQSTISRSLTGRGRPKLTIEAVHTRQDLRAQGIGTAMMEHAIEGGVAKDVRLIQLMSNQKRTEAHQFYERMGFEKSHFGFKIRR